MMRAEREKALLKQEEVKEHNHKAKCEILEWKNEITEKFVVIYLCWFFESI